MDVAERLALLWPPQQVVRVQAAGCRLAPRVRLKAEPRAALEPTVRRFAARMSTLGVACAVGADTDAGSVEILITLDPSSSRRPQGYTLHIDARGVRVDAADIPGAFYALCTLEQLVRLFHVPDGSAGIALPGLTIEDWPDFPHRGVLLDVSRTKVPTLATLFEIVDWLASMKINQLQLYTEHTFAYRGHECVWNGSSALTGADIEALDAHARERHVELVPNQQSFGHLHRWLAHDRYRALAEVPEGIVHAFSLAKDPYGLCPVDPASFTFLGELYDQLLPHFSSGLFNVGLDETVDLGLGRSKEACRERGAARVYADFLGGVHRLVRDRGRRMQFFGDMLHEHREILDLIPRDAVVLEWGYEADYAFEEHCAPLAEHGLEFYVCPGTSSWQSIGGRTDNALRNLDRAARIGIDTGASGYLITDWGDRGHLQPLAVSLVGLTAGAGSAWNAARAGAAFRPEILDQHAYRDDTRVLGRAACDLGNAYRECGAASTNGSALFFLIAFAAEPLPHPRMPGLSRAGLERTLASLAEIRQRLARCIPSREATALAADELRWACDLMQFACRLGSARVESDPALSTCALSASARRALGGDLAPLIEQHRRLWRRRYRPGGLSESAAWLERCLASLA